MTARLALMQVGVRAILIGTRDKASPSLPYRFMGEEAISVLAGLHCKTKLHSTEADSVLASQRNRNVASVRERFPHHSKSTVWPPWRLTGENNEVTSSNNLPHGSVVL
jgi:hypothetical protein